MYNPISDNGVNSIYMVRYAIWYHLYNLKNVKNTHGWVLIIVACNFTKINTPPRVFFTFFKLYKWYQIAQRTTYIYWLFFLLFKKFIECLLMICLLKAYWKPCQHLRWSVLFVCLIAVNYFRKILHKRCLTGFWIRLCITQPKLKT